MSHLITFLTSIREQFAFSAVRSRKEAHKGTHSWNGVWDLLRLHRNFLDQHPVPRLALSEQLVSNICNPVRVVKYDSHKRIISLHCRYLADFYKMHRKMDHYIQFTHRTWAAFVATTMQHSAKSAPNFIVDPVLALQASNVLRGGKKKTNSTIC